VVAELYQEEDATKNECEGESGADQQCSAAAGGSIAAPAAVRQQLRDSLVACDLHPQEVGYFVVYYSDESLSLFSPPLQFLGPWLVVNPR
jgi:hypothetical protein